MATERARVFIAVESFTCQLADEDGSIRSYDVYKNATRVREGHPLLKANLQYFRPIDDHVHYDIESAGGGEPVTRRESAIVPPAPPAQAEIDATDNAIRAAAAAGVDISQIKGTGPGGRVTKTDVDAVIASAQAS